MSTTWGNPRTYVRTDVRTDERGSSPRGYLSRALRARAAPGFAAGEVGVSGSVIRKPMQPRYDELCADLIGVLERLAAHVGAPEIADWLTCEGCGTLQRADTACPECAARR